MAIFLIPIIVSVSAQNRTVIYGNFPKFKDSISILSYSYIGNEGEIKNAPDTEIKNGIFKIVLSINSPRWISIDVNNKNLFHKDFLEFAMIITPSDSIVLDIHDYGLENINATGKGAAKFNFTKALVHERKTKLKRKIPLNESISDFIYHTEKDLVLLEELIENFRPILSEIGYNVMLAKTYVEAYNLVTKRFVEIELSEDELQLAKKVVLHNRRFKFLRELDPAYSYVLPGSYYTILSELAYLNRIISTGRKFTLEETNDLVFKYNILKYYYTGYKIKDNVLGRFLIVRLRKKNIDEKLENCIQDFLSNADRKNNSYRIVKDLKDQSINKLAKGSIIENYSFIDSLGNEKFLSDFKGKVTIIDFWFNLCYGCALITPQLNEIKEHFKGQDVTFVSINIDKDKKNWLKGIGKFAPLHAIHLNTNFEGISHPMIKYFQITAMPTLIILDKQGRIFNQRATLPTLPDTKERLVAEIEEVLY